MPDAAAVRAFIDGYRDAFLAFDLDAVAARFAFPLQATADGAEVRLDVVPDAAAWRPALERLADAYRRIGVRAAAIERLDVAEVTARVAHAIVRWSLADAGGQRIYAFTASYTLVDGEGGARIVAIAHDEGPRLQLALAKAAGGRPA